MPISATLPSDITHNHPRLFQPEKLMEPRDFKLPSYNQPVSLPLIVEIGAGKGRHALQYARKNPHHNLIAIERTTNKYEALAKNLQKIQLSAPLNNIIAVHADAIPYCVYALAAHSVTTIYILYPNPEPKNPNQQWLNMPFFEFLLSRVKPQGGIVLASNIQAYIDNAYTKAVEVWQLPSQLTKIPASSARTHFEIKYLQRGETCWEINMLKPVHYRTHFDNWQPSVNA